MIFGSKESFAIEYEVHQTADFMNAACVLWVRWQPVGEWENIGADSTIGDALGSFASDSRWKGEPPWPEEPEFMHMNDRQILELVIQACWSGSGFLYPSITKKVEQMWHAHDAGGDNSSVDPTNYFSAYCLMPRFSEPFGSSRMVFVPLGGSEKLIWNNRWDPQLHSTILPAGTVVRRIREFMAWWQTQRRGV